MMSAIDQIPRLTPEEMRENHEYIVKQGNEDLEGRGEDVFIWPHELALKVSYVKSGLVHLPEGIELPKEKEEFDGFDRLFKEKIYPDEAFYEVLLTRLYPKEVKIDSKEKLAKSYRETFNREILATWSLAGAVQLLAQNLLYIGDKQFIAHIIYQLPGIVNEKTQEGATLLCLVAASNKEKISDVAAHQLMQILINLGAKTSVKGFFEGKEVTPLYLACANKKQWLARLLLRHQEVGNDDLQEFRGNVDAIKTLFSAWGNSGCPECPQSKKIQEIRSKMRELNQEELGKAMEVLESAPDEWAASREREKEREDICGSSPSPSPSPSSSSSLSPSAERFIESIMDEVARNRDNHRSTNDTTKKTSLLARLVISAIIGGLFGWFVGLRKTGIVVSSVIGAFLGTALARERSNRRSVVSSL